MKFRHLLLLAGGVAAASQAYALSIGSPRGNVYLGSAVDLSFQVQPDPGQTVDSSCISAQVWMGDTALLDKDVLVTMQASSVRVRTTAPVYEPLVTLKLTAGCAGVMTRSYTLFADPPATMAAAVAPINLNQLQVNVPAAAALPPLALARTLASTPSRAVAPSAVKRTRPAKRPINRSAIAAVAQSVEVPQENNAPSPAVEAAAQDTAPMHVEQPRLRIEPIEGLDQPVAASDATLAPDSGNEAVPTETVSNSEAQVQQLLQASDARLVAMEEQLKTLQTQLTTNRTEISGLHNQLAQAQNAPLPTWIYVLLGMLALALATIAWLLQRVKQERLNAQSTWADTVLAVDENPTAETLPTVTPSVPQAPVTIATPVAATPIVLPDVAPLQTPLAPQVTPSAAAPSLIDQQLPTPEPEPEPQLPVFAMAAAATAATKAVAAPASPSTAALDEVLTAQAMFDVQEQAEFYASIGENDHAIGILQNHIAQHEASSPLAYLELLQLLHRLSRTDAFAHASKKFQAYFNVNVPGFFEFANKGQDLATGYPQVLRQIEAQWSSEELPGFISGLLVRDPSQTDKTPSERFDLAAFKDLLKLYNDVKTTSAAKRGAFAGSATAAAANSAAAVMPAAAMFLDMPLAVEQDSTPLKLADAHLDMLSTAPADFSQAALQPVSDSPYQATNHFTPDEALFDGLSLDWESAVAPSAPVAASDTVLPDLELTGLDAQLQAFLEEDTQLTPPPSAEPRA